MLPFLLFANQNQVQRGNDPPPNLFTSSSSALPNQVGFNNPQMLMPAMGGFNNQNAFLSTLLTHQHMMQGLQNNLMGALLQQGMMPQLPGQQLNLLGVLQSPNFMSLQHDELLGRPPMGQNLNQMLGFSPNGLVGVQNPIFPPIAQLPVIGSGNSNPGLLGLTRKEMNNALSTKKKKNRSTKKKKKNPGLLGNGSTLAGQSSSSSKGLEIQITSQKLQESNLPGPVQNNKSNNGRQRPQMTHGQTGGKNFSNNSSDNVASNNFNPKFNEQGKMEPSHMRFQKSQSYNSRNAWQKERRFAKNNRRGQHRRKESTNLLASNTPNLRKRPISVVYSESEIQQWREARKNYFPTRANIEKKLKSESAKKEEMDSHAKIRRQQLKEVLAKQAELGVQVAEIPSIYLTKPEDQNSKIANPDEALNINIEAPFKHFMNKKRGRFRHNKLNAKRLKLKNETAPAHEPVVKKRGPALLRKLLNADIRSLSVVYSESEIQQWREARKNYFPTRTNIEKKLKSGSANKEEMDSHAKIRWQQLKEVLAKQAEIGVTYGIKLDYQNSKIMNKQRGWFRRNKRNAKRLKLKNETASAHEPVVKKRKRTLLRKPLVFPIITAKGAQPKSEKKPLDCDTNFRVESGNAEEVERKTDSA